MSPALRVHLGKAIFSKPSRVAGGRTHFLETLVVTGVPEFLQVSDTIG